MSTPMGLDILQTIGPYEWEENWVVAERKKGERVENVPQ